MSDSSNIQTRVLRVRCSVFRDVWWVQETLIVQRHTRHEIILISVEQNLWNVHQFKLRHRLSIFVVGFRHDGNEMNWKDKEKKYLLVSSDVRALQPSPYTKLYTNLYRKLDKQPRLHFASCFMLQSTSSDASEVNVEPKLNEYFASTANAKNIPLAAVYVTSYFPFIKATKAANLKRAWCEIH